MASLSEQIEQYEDRSDLTPLIDVVFLLLLFFVLTTTFADETFFPIEMPTAERAVVRTLDDAAVLEITADGQMALDRAYVRSRRALHEELERRTEANTLRTLIVKADRKTHYENVVWVMDVMQALEIDEFSFAVREDER